MSTPCHYSTDGSDAHWEVLQLLRTGTEALGPPLRHQWYFLHQQDRVSVADEANGSRE
jgi:hypothetical protein